MKLPTPREVAEQVIRDNGELGLNRAAEVIVADRESVREACLGAIADAGGDNAEYYAASIRAMDLTGEPK